MSVRRSVMCVVFMACGAAGCSQKSPDLPAPAVPASLDQLDPAIAQRIRAVLRRIDADPNDPDLRVELGKVYMANGLTESARQCLGQAVEFGAHDPRAWYYLAHARTEEGDYSGALAALDQVVALDEDYAPAYWQRGLWHLDLGETDRAEAAFGETDRVAPSSSEAVLGMTRVHLRRAEHTLAVELIEQYLLTSDRNRVYATYLLGLAYRGLGRLDEADEALRLGTGSVPRFPDPWLIELESYAEGYQAQLHRARNKASVGRFDDAIDILNDLTRDRTVTVEVYNNLGLSYLGAEEIDRAIEVLEQAVVVNANSLEAHHLLAGAYWLASDDLAEQDKPQLYELALTHVQRSLEINPAYVPALGLHGDILARRGVSVAAIDAYKEAARWDPKNPQWLYQAALVYGSLRSWDDVVECLESATATSPAFEDAMSRLGLAYIAQGRYEDAEATLRRALSLNPDYTERIRQMLNQLEQSRQE